MQLINSVRAPNQPFYDKDDLLYTKKMMRTYMHDRINNQYKIYRTEHSSKDIPCFHDTLNHFDTHTKTSILKILLI